MIITITILVILLLLTLFVAVRDGNHCTQRDAFRQHFIDMKYTLASNGRFRCSGDWTQYFDTELSWLGENQFSVDNRHYDGHKRHADLLLAMLKASPQHVDTFGKITATLPTGMQHYLRAEIVRIRAERKRGAHMPTPSQMLQQKRNATAASLRAVQLVKVPSGYSAMIMPDGTGVTFRRIWGQAASMHHDEACQAAWGISAATAMERGGLRYDVDGAEMYPDKELSGKQIAIIQQWLADVQFEYKGSNTRLHNAAKNALYVVKTSMVAEFHRQSKEEAGY